MSSELPTINLDPLRVAIGGWFDEQGQLETKVSDSLDALEAYRSHLEAWQNELIAQRDALAEEQAKLHEARSEPKTNRSELNGHERQVEKTQDPPNQEPAPEANPPRVSHPDPVLRSVVAQFDKIRKQVADTRKQKKY